MVQVSALSSLASCARHIVVTTYYFVPFATLTSINVFACMGIHQASVTTKHVCDFSMTLPKALLIEPWRQ